MPNSRHRNIWPVSSVLLASTSHTASQTTTNLAIRPTLPEMGWTLAEARHIEVYPVQGALTGTTGELFTGLTLGGHSAPEEMRFGAVTGAIVELGI